jgi:hypothetical protein
VLGRNVRAKALLINLGCPPGLKAGVIQFLPMLDISYSLKKMLSSGQAVKGHVRVNCLVQIRSRAPEAEHMRLNIRLWVAFSFHDA